MRYHQLCYIFCALLLFGWTQHAFCQPFEMDFNLQRAHIAKVIIGCQEGATRGFDRRVDIYAPPPGMQTGYAGLVSNDPKMPLLYKDIRDISLPQEWKLLCQPEGNQSITVTWDEQQVPAGLNMTLKYEGRDFDMRKVKKVEVRNKTTLVIELKKDAAQNDAAAP